MQEEIIYIIKTCNAGNRKGSNKIQKSLPSAHLADNRVSACSTVPMKRFNKQQQKCAGTETFTRNYIKREEDIYLGLLVIVMSH